MQVLRCSGCIHFSSLLVYVQESIDSVTGAQTDDPDRKASGVTAQCFQSAVDSTKVFDLALSPTVCQDCQNVIYDSNSRENLAAQVKHGTLLQFFLLFLLLIFGSSIRDFGLDNVADLIALA